MTGAIAVVGMACQVPGADDIDGFWDLLVAGRQQFGAVPPGRMPGYDPEWTGVPDIRAALLERPDLFDAEFFGISSHMAAWMDPQQRLLLETSWRAFEDAAIAPSSLRGVNAGVYLATTSTDFRDQVIRTGAVDRFSALGLLSTFHANRISYQYDLRGPSITLDTACAGGLTSVGLAVSALRSGEIDLAVAGAVNVLGFGYMHAVMMKFGALSPTGNARSFDAAADGYVRGEGAFLVVLKRLADAMADGDPVHAVIRGCAISHDGRAGGLVRTDSGSQERLISRALAEAGMSIEDVGCVEAHAAGTLVGDATEVMTLRRMLTGHSRCAGPGEQMWVGSVKPNIGHLEGAAGAAGLMKALLMLRHGAIAPTPGFHNINPRIDLDSVPLSVADRLLEWPSGRRFVGVNSFGVGGSNAHVLMESGPQREASPPSSGMSAVPISAASPVALEELAFKLADKLDTLGENMFPVVVRTLRHGRATLKHRRVVLADGVAALRDRLRSGVDDSPVTDWAPDPGPRMPLVPYPFQRRSYWFDPAYNPLAEFEVS